MKFKTAILSTGIAITLWAACSFTHQSPAAITTLPVGTKMADIRWFEIKQGLKKDLVPAKMPRGLNISPEDAYMETLDMLARCVEAEAGNQGLEGKRLVADVILNRVRDSGFPDSVQEVITQEYHFSVYWAGAMDRVTISEETWQVVKMELKEVGYPGVFYFREGDWPFYGTPWRKVGDHYLSKLIERDFSSSNGN